MKHSNLNSRLSTYPMVTTAMHVSVRFFTTLREVTGKREEILHFDDRNGVTVSLLLEKLAEIHGRRFVEYVYDAKTKEVKGFLQFLINGRSISSFEGLQTRLSNDDVLAIIPPVGGG